jgi:predicted nucleic acid-binding protein
MRVLLDTDVLLDVLLARAPFSEAAFKLLDMSQQRVFEAYISGISPVNIFYIARKAKGSDELRRALTQLLRTTRVCPLNHSILTDGLTSPIRDYEDAVQHACAVAAGLDAIVTRNLDDYKNATLPIFSPTDFLSHIKSQQS